MKENVNVNDYTAFVVRENVFNGNKTLITNTDSTSKLLFSTLKGKVICASYVNKTMKTLINDYFMKDKSVIKGSINLRYHINDAMKYCDERYTENVLDVIARSVLSDYFSNLKINDELSVYKVSNSDKEALIALMNYFINQIIPYVKLHNMSDIIIDKKNELSESFRYIPYDKLNAEENDESFDAEYYAPLTRYLSDDLTYNKMMYPDKVYVPYDAVLSYRGDLRYHGTHRGKNARGNILYEGKRIFSSLPVLFTAGNIGNEYNKYMVYPNIIYSVNDLETYINNYDKIITLFNLLTKKIVTTCYTSKDEIECIISIDECKNGYITNILKELEQYNVNVEYITYSVKNPCVRQKQRIKKVSDIFAKFIKSND